MRMALSGGRAIFITCNNSVMPNPSIFIDTIHLQEAKSSSEIENIITALVVDMVETTSIQGLKRLERIITLMDETALKDKN